MATHSNILSWRIPQRGLAGYSPCGCKESGKTERLIVSLSALLFKCGMFLSFFLKYKSLKYALEKKIAI